MTVKEHYEQHLGNFYTWMAGDFSTKQREQEEFFREHGIAPSSTRIAIDLGAGHGVQSVSLARLGFYVWAIDFNPQLLSALIQNKQNYPIEIIEDDIRNVAAYSHPQPELIVCCGDTLTHLESRDDVERLIRDCTDILAGNGKLVVSFRDYSVQLCDESRFIPVKSDETRILTCFLEYFPDRVRVHDLLHEKIDGVWRQKVSSYDKLRISPAEFREVLERYGMKILFDEPVSRMHTFIAAKPALR